MAWYNEYLQNCAREEIIERILAYIEDDCRPMIAVKDYFQRRAKNRS
ncbi:MAG: hypothetical protein BMS9Abin10_0576 [Gammaproteobacteria bacterium]|nr:MAG: hypothetical protein BMS9Abin10_0576 [Gammaproteobacteria bacterium]